MRSALSLLCLLSIAHPVHAADRTDWSKVHKISAETKTVITRRDSSVLVGAFVASDASSLTIMTGMTGRQKEIVARDDIMEVATRQKGRGFWGHLGPIGGYLVGGLGGGYIAGIICNAARGGGCDTGAFLTGMLIGGVTGSLNGLYEAGHETDKVVYRAP